MKERLAIVHGVRTPFCKAGTVLKSMQADDLGAIAVRELLAQSGFPAAEIDEVIIGNVSQPIDATNIARVIMLKAGLPVSIPAFSVNRNCASGMQSITTAADRILAGEADVIVAGGAESMSNAPLFYGPEMVEILTKWARAKTFIDRARALKGFRPSLLKPIIGVERGLTDAICRMNMGRTAEVLAREFKVTREDQDEFALLSHTRAARATAEGFLKGEIVPVPVPPRFASVQEQDSSIRADQSIEALRALKPIFDRDAGTVTAGNACPLTDGAAAVLVMLESRARARGLKPLGYLRAYAYAGLEGNRMGLGPVYATARLLDKTGLRMDEFAAVEVNEAFAAQVIACERAFGSDEFARRCLNRETAVGRLDRERLNVNGGAIALGHPVGTSGTRLVITLLRELKRRGAKRGLASLCVGGGQGAALALESE